MSDASVLQHCGPPAVEPAVGEYYVPTYPPFAAWSYHSNSPLLQVPGPLPPTAPLALYVHVPFCVSKCDFCNNHSYIGARDNVVHSYVDAVAKEADLYGRQHLIQRRPVSSVYIGGGTPSALTVDQIDRLVSGIQYSIPWRETREVTFECAPRSVRAHFMEALRSLGITRVSLGVQSFNNLLLKLNGRIHYAEDTLRAARTIREVGFQSFNIDLMVGLLGETEHDWADTLARTIALGPDSITVYQTEVPRGTQLYRDYQENRLPTDLVSWEVKHTRVERAFETLEAAGYTVASGYSAIKSPDHLLQYEKHIATGGDLLGLGVSAFSFLGKSHFQNDITLESYESELIQDKLPLKRTYKLNESDRLVREFILQLKCGSVNTASLQSKFGHDPVQLFQDLLNGLENDGFLLQSDSRINLTRKGLVCVDRLLPRFFAPEFSNL